jgi:hypothetical protein
VLAAVTGIANGDPPFLLNRHAGLGTPLIIMLGESCSPLPSLPRIVGIVIVNLSTGFNHEEENSNPNPDYRCEQDKKCFHDLAPQVRMIYATIDCTDDGENGLPLLRKT